MNKWMIFAGVVLLILFFKPEAINNVFGKKNVTQQAIPKEVNVADEVIVPMNPNFLGTPSNKYGVFPCNYDSDCKIYFDCDTCFCDKASGDCYTTGG